MFILELLFRIICLLLCPVVSVIYVLLSFVASLFISYKKEYKNDSVLCRALINFGAWYYAVILSNVKVVFSGKEKIPEGKFLIVSNHRSNYDPILTWLYLKEYRLSFISKKSNISMPIFGKLVHRCGFMPIDRENPKEAIKTIITAAKKISFNDYSVSVYPEGTRSKSDKLLDFHDGVLKIAKKADCPVVVMSVKNTEKVHKHPFIKRTVVYLDVIDVFNKDKVNSYSSSELGEMARDIINKQLS